MPRFLRPRSLTQALDCRTAIVTDGLGRGTGPGEFGLPHNVVTDAEGRVYVTDRDNRRIQVFGPDGNFLEEWTDTGEIGRASCRERVC